MDRRDELLLKFKQGIISQPEADELVATLQQETEQARKDKDIATLIALGLMIAALTAVASKK